jgi:hypothetical protein
MHRTAIAALCLAAATGARADWVGSSFEDAMTDQKGATMVGRFYGGDDSIPAIGIRCTEDGWVAVGVVTGAYNDAAKYKPMQIDIRVDHQKPMAFIGVPENKAGYVNYQAEWTPKQKGTPTLVDLVRYIGGARERVVLGTPTHNFIMEEVGETARIAQNMITTCHLPGGDIPVPEHQDQIPVAPAAHAEATR